MAPANGLKQGDLSAGFLQEAGRRGLRLLAALGLIAAITFVSYRLIPVNAATAGFFYLVAILLVATAGGFLEATAASVVAMLCFNYFFLPPVGTFTIADPQNWVALSAFLSASLIASRLSERARRRTQEAIRQRHEMERLYALSRAILLTDAAQPVAKQIAHQIAHTFEFPAVALYDRARGEIYRAGPQSLPGIDGRLREAVVRSTLLQEEAGKVLIIPIRLGGEPIGSLAVRGASLSDAALESLLNLVAVGLEKARAQETVNRAEVARQSEELKSTLLDAIAHEFKSPLTSIKAVTTDLLSDPSNALPQTQREMLTIADEGADRLDRLVTEAIQLARIEGGKFRLNQEVHFPSSLISGALRQMQPLTDGREVRVVAPDDLPLVLVDSELIQLVIRQLIDNALKYSPPDGAITIDAQAGGDGVTISVADQGQGIAEEEQLRIFDKFYRSVKDRHQIKGTGMGLPIAREILRAHGGDIWVKSNPGQGSEFCFSLPAASKERIA